MKVVMIIIGAVFTIATLFVLCIITHILWRYLGIIYNRIDEYFDMRERTHEQEEIYKFKKNL